MACVRKNALASGRGARYADARVATSTFSAMVSMNEIGWEREEFLAYCSLGLEHQFCLHSAMHRGAATQALRSKSSRYMQS